METKYIIFLLTCVLNVVVDATSDPMITAPAELVVRQADETIIGYWSNAALGWRELTCNSSSTYSTSGRYGDCCGVNSLCLWATACLGLTSVLQNVDSGSCESGDFCTTRTIFEDASDRTPHYQIGCWAAAATRFPEAFTAYRTTPSSTTTSSTRPTIITNSIPSLFTTSSGIVVFPTTSAPTPSPTSPSPNKKGKAWIAGAVIGPVFAMVILGLAVWIHRLRRENVMAKMSQSSQYSAQQPRQSQAYYAPSEQRQSMAYYAQPQQYFQQPQSPVFQQGPQVPQQQVAPPPQVLPREPEHHEPENEGPQTPELPNRR